MINCLQNEVFIHVFHDAAPNDAVEWYSGKAGFDFTGVVFLSHFREIRGQCLKIVYNRFLPQLSRFIFPFYEFI
jgi:hypothetical protein